MDEEERAVSEQAHPDRWIELSPIFVETLAEAIGTSPGDVAAHLEDNVVADHMSDEQSIRTVLDEYIAVG